MHNNVNKGSILTEIAEKEIIRIPRIPMIPIDLPFQSSDLNSPFMFRSLLQLKKLKAKHLNMLVLICALTVSYMVSYIRTIKNR
jgi:hypothetical protein